MCLFVLQCHFLLSNPNYAFDSVNELEKKVLLRVLTSTRSIVVLRRKIIFITPQLKCMEFVDVIYMKLSVVSTVYIKYIYLLAFD